MRVVLAGGDDDRARLRPALEESGIEIAAERESLAAARGVRPRVDAIVLAVSADVADPEEPDDDVIHEPLTRREIDVLTLMADGLSNKSIAERLGISPQTVKFHAAAVIAKLAASNRTEAVRLALRRGLVAI